jgi:endonuclease/exonuclease/phosphatase (EEP) superfamily protein YafD
MVSLRWRFCVVQIAVMDVCAFLKRGFLMIVPMKMNRIAFAAFALLTATWPATVHAQDVPGIEICTVEKTMERRTSCLQSNVDFLQKTITKLTSDQQQKLDASNRQIEALKGAVIGLQKIVVELQAAQKAAEDAKKAATPAAKDVPPAAKESAK